MAAVCCDHESGTVSIANQRESPSWRQQGCGRKAGICLRYGHVQASVDEANNYLYRPSNRKGSYPMCSAWFGQPDAAVLRAYMPVRILFLKNGIDHYSEEFSLYSDTVQRKWTPAAD
ncbi:MAG: hypothetical protein A4E62_02593 [Syntrophorhabdus sp. PtaU1.Bin002]|nr:MAG: hypothetical protein A4E62_02593 [Syntrophorhabdus sp. PtaU1.Bin002]